MSPTYHSEVIRTRLATDSEKGRGALANLARHLRIHPSLVTRIGRGGLVPTQEQGLGICEYLGMSGLDRDLFMEHINLERAGTPALRAYFERKIAKLDARKKRTEAHVPDATVKTDGLQISTLFASWHSVAVFLVVSLPPGRHPADIAETLQLPLRLVARILEDFTRIGLCTAEADGTYTLRVKYLHLQRTSPLMLQHLCNWRNRATEAFNFRREGIDLFFSAPVTISQRDFERFQGELNQFIQRFLTELKSTEPEVLACLNLDWFQFAEFAP